MDNVKQNLLKTGQFIDCESLDNYVGIIEMNRDKKAIKGKTDRHHILPESLFEARNLPENNTPECFVNLLYGDHILAHYYLWEASIPNSKQAYCNSYAVCFMTNSRKVPDKHKLMNDLPKYQSLREDWRVFLSKTQTGKVVSTATRRKIGDAARGRAKSEHTRQLLSASLTGRKLSEEHRQSLRHPKSTTINMRKPKSEQAKLNMSLSKIGKKRGPRSESVKKKISDALMGHSVSEEVKQASKEANTGKKCLFKDGEYRWFFTEGDISSALESGWILKGRPKTDSSRDALSKAHTGRIWVTNDSVTKQVSPDELLHYEELGFRRGRK